MILIYSYNNSPRLQYICSIIFQEILNISFRITIDEEEFKNWEKAKINYSQSRISNIEYRISNINLLFEETIEPQNIACFEADGYKAFFKIEDSDYEFDIFAASFYLLSRYEEYLPHQKDIYGRYAHENALAFKEGFLHLPIINIWVNNFAKRLKNFFDLHQPSTLNLKPSTFNFLPTYDIDMAFSYKYKGWKRNLGGFLKSPSVERIKVLLGFQKDPFDCFKWMDDLHKEYKLSPVYFFLIAENNGIYDKNILPAKSIMWRLIKHHKKRYKIGIHPSWQSGDDDLMLQTEIEMLEEMAETTSANDQQLTINLSRQHYIRFNLPDGYQRLIDAGITDDYSMGYGSINGFRASIANSFYWYDLQNNQQTPLRIHPFCFMEANSFYEQKYSASEAFEELMGYYKICKEINGTLITIWHNNFLGTDRQFVEWRNFYERFIKEISFF